MSDWRLDARGLYAIVDPEHCAGRVPREVAQQILEGGCAVLQLRDKRSSDRAILTLARELRALCAARGVPFVMNDRADIAALVDADGLHLGQDDLRVAEARATVGDMCIGVSTHDLAQALRAEGEGADLIGFGPIFRTATKQNPDPVVGLEGLRSVCSAVRVPVIAIGGISAPNATDVLACGPRFIAAISSVAAAERVTEASRALHELARAQS